MHRLRGAAMLLVVTAAANTTKTNQTKSLAAVVEDAMKASVKQYKQVKTTKDAQQVVRDIFSVPSKEETNLGKILILNGKVFANRHEGKVYGHLVNTARALMEKNDVGNLAYLHESGASGRCATNQTGKKIKDLPSTLIARDGYSSDRCGVLVPNPYFGNFDHRQREDDRLLRAAALNEYDARTPRAFWRGHLRQMRSCHTKEGVLYDKNEKPWKVHRFCERENGNIARFQGFLLTLQRPHLFDVKAQKIDGGNRWFTPSYLRRYNCTQGLFDEMRPGYLEELLAKFKNGGAQEAKHTAPVDYAKYRILAHFPGGTSGSYSRNLNHLWAMGAPVMIWDHPAQEHYYAALEDGVTHVVFNATTAVGVAEHLIRHKRGFTKRLREGAARVQRELTCAQCLNRYFLATLAELRSRFRGDLALGTREAARATLRGVNCTGHDLVEYIADDRMTMSTKNTDRGIRSLPHATTRAERGEDPRCLALLDRAFPVKNLSVACKTELC